MFRGQVHGQDSDKILYLNLYYARKLNWFQCNRIFFVSRKNLIWLFFYYFVVKVKIKKWIVVNSYNHQ